MARAIQHNAGEKTFLTDWDPAGDDYVVIKVADTGINAARQDHFNEVVFERTRDGVVRQITNWSLSGLVLKELWLTFAGSNLTAAKDDATVSIFPEHAVAFDEFCKIVATLPPELTEEWHRAVLKLNPDWQTLR